MDLLALSFGGIAGALASRALLRTHEHRGSAQGVADLLNWAFMVDDGVVLQKDGSLLAGWRYEGPDVSAATAQELDNLSQHVNDALLPLTDEWMLHVDAIRRPASAYASSTFPDAVSQLIDDERRAAYEKTASRQFETEYFLVLTRSTPPETFSRLRSAFVQGLDRSAVDWGRVLADFEAATSALEDRISSYLSLRRLDSPELLRHLHECLTGLNHPVREPPAGSYLNVVLSDQQLLGGFEPRIGDMAIRIVAVQGYPHASHAAESDFLNALPIAFRSSTRVIPLGEHEAARQLRRHQLQWFKKRKGAGAWVQEMVSNGRKGTSSAMADDELWLDQDAKGMARDAADASAENASAAVRFCYATQVVVVTDADATCADRSARLILKTLNDVGFAGRIENVNALDAFLGSLPGHGYPNLRRPLLSTRNLADLLPVTSVWPGLAQNPSSYFPIGSPPLMWGATEGSTPFRINLHDSDVGHALVLGKTGSGKSVLLGMLAAQFLRYESAQVFVFDIGYSMWALARGCEAVHYDLAAGADALRFQPLRKIDEPAERAWATEWLETLFALQGVMLTPALRKRVSRALDLVAGNGPEHRTLTELMVQLQDESLSNGIAPYTLIGSCGQLLDANADQLAQARFQVFEMKHLLELDNRIALPVLLYLFHRIEKRLDGSPTLIEIDEAWMALMHSLFGARINQWLLTLRKQNAAVVLATQSPAQLEQLPNRHTIVDSCPTKFYLPNAEALSAAQRSLYRDLGLSDREVTIIAQATPKRHYYFKSPRGSRLFELALGEFARAFLTSVPGFSMDETKRRIESLMALHGDDWAAAWLAERGFTDWATRLRVCRNSRQELHNDNQLVLPIAV